MKKFRFDSFASEFASNDDDDVKTPTTGLSTKLDETADNDSGIGKFISKAYFFFFFFFFSSWTNSLGVIIW